MSLEPTRQFRHSQLNTLPAPPAPTAYPNQSQPQISYSNPIVSLAQILSSSTCCYRHHTVALEEQDSSEEGQ